MKFIAVIIAAFLAIAVHADATAAVVKPAAFGVGDVKITALQDTPGNMPVSIFHGAPEAEMNKFASAGTVPAGVTVFLMQKDDRIVLIDTGNGPGKGSLAALLEKQGFKPEDITDILLTHMHGDHIGGLIESGTSVYPKAKIQVSAPELYYWTQNAAPGLEANAAKAKAVQKAYGERLATFQFGVDVLPGIQALAAVGHTPGHTAFLLTVPGSIRVEYSGKNMGHGAVLEDAKKLLFWGDIVHGAAIQFPLPEVCAKYDMNPAEAVDTRKSMMGMAADTKIPVAGAHLPFPAIGRVARDGKAFKFTPGL